ncbi:MAG: Asp23/Gls24 family envelope stress response protein [Lachnospiraceae bacterium]|nr:Asp23/Gls24 family envelope stress response protein [Lachnospiraceae bacterium]
MASKMEKRVIHMIDDCSFEGNLIIPEDAFETIATLAALEVKGVLSVDGITREKVRTISTKNISSWVKVDVNEEKKTVRVYISIELDYGYNIPDTCRRVQEKVQNTVQSMTGFTAPVVNIKICGVKVTV